jgi:hypothetical protein
LQGRPTPLTSEETGEMVEWILDLGPVLAEAIDLVCRSPYPRLGNSMLYYQLSESNLVSDHPDDIAKLLLFLTTGENGRPIYDLGQLYTVVDRLVNLTPGNRNLHGLCDQLARLGVAGVRGLASRLVNQN